MSWLSDVLERRPDWAQTLSPDLTNTDYSQLRPGRTGEAFRSAASPGYLFDLGWHGQENPTEEQKKEQRWTIPLFRTLMSTAAGGAASSFFPTGSGSGSGGGLGGEGAVGAYDPGASSMYADAPSWGVNPGGAGEFAGAGTGFESNPGAWSDAVPGTSSGTPWWQQGTQSAATGGTNWSQLFGQGGAGNTGIGALLMLLNANKQRQEAKEPTMSDAERQAIAQQGVDAMARSLSTEGNPAGSGRAQRQLTNYAAQSLARMKYQDELERKARARTASNNMYGAGTFGLQAILAALAQGGAFSGGGETA